MKKYKRDEVIKVIIDKMLEPHGSSYDEILANPEINGESWYQYYKWTEKEREDFKNFFIFTLMKNTRPLFKKHYAEIEWKAFDLMYGLKLIENEQKL
jgi:hypothetical protein